MLNSWDFDILPEKDFLKRYRLIYIMLDNFQLLTHFQISKKTLLHFLDRASDLYNQNGNPFHNFDHGFTGMDRIIQ